MPSRGRVACVDIGTNTVLLLVAEGPESAPRAVLERATITRLGQGVDRTSRLAPDAIARTLACLSEYGNVARGHAARSIHAVCTSAARDAENGAEFLALATDALGARPRIIDGDEEARLTIDGAITGLDLHGDVMVFDVGGGSTEIVRGKVTSSSVTVDLAMSLDIGSVRLTERHVRSDPPLQAELLSIRADIDRALETALALHGSDRTVPAMRSVVVGVAGTVTTLSSIHQGLSVYDPARVHGSRLSKDTIAELSGRLSTLAHDARCRTTGLELGRADVIVAGAAIVQAILHWSGETALTVSDRGVRWGLARAALARS